MLVFNVGHLEEKNLQNLEYNLLLLFNRYFGIEHTEGEEEQLEWYTQIFGMTLSWLLYWIHLRKVFILLQNQQPQYFKRKGLKIVDQQTEIELAEGEEDNDRIRMQLKNATHQRFWRQTNAFTKIKQLVLKVLCILLLQTHKESSLV